MLSYASSDISNGNQTISPGDQVEKHRQNIDFDEMIRGRLTL